MKNNLVLSVFVALVLFTSCGLSEKEKNDLDRESVQLMIDSYTLTCESCKLAIEANKLLDQGKEEEADKKFSQAILIANKAKILRDQAVLTKIKNNKIKESYGGWLFIILFFNGKRLSLG